MLEHVWDWRMVRSEIWIGMSVSLIFSCSLQTAVIHSGAAERKHESFFFFLPLLCFSSSAEAFSCLLSISIAHLFSFVFPLLSPFNPFSSLPTLSRFPLQPLSFQPHLSIFPLPTSIQSSSTNSALLPPPVCHLWLFLTDFLLENVLSLVGFVLLFLPF